MLERIVARGVWDRDGAALRLPPEGATGVVVARVGDDEPLFRTEVLVAEQAPHLVLRGLGAAAMLCGAERMILAVHATARGARRRLEAEALGSRVELLEVPASAPSDPASLICDLAQVSGKSVPAAGLDRALVLDAVELRDVGLALGGASLSRSRYVTVVGAVRDPAVVVAPLGTSCEDLVASCGGSPEPGWVPWHNGVLRGRPVGRDQVVDLDTRGFFVLPHQHPLVRRRCTPLQDLVKRVPSACEGCRICTDTCPVALAGGHLAPHEVMRAVAAAEDDQALLGALECSRCGLCTALCPTCLAPAEIIAATSEELRARGVELSKVEWRPQRPHRDRLGRRISVERLAAMMGVRVFEDAERPRHLVPDRISLPLVGVAGSERVAAVQPGQRVDADDTLILAPHASAEPDLHSPLAGRVEAVDLDDGVSIRVF
jgi:Na+-translocating ferredoxin:NAD+ oxidoreductase RnfC subunit